MPLYNLFVISKASKQLSVESSELKHAIKRVTNRLLDSNSAIVQKLEFLGTRKLPYRMKLQGQHVYEGSYWQLQFFSNPKLLDDIKFHIKYDADIIRYTILKQGDKLKDYVHAVYQ